MKHHLIVLISSIVLEIAETNENILTQDKKENTTVPKLFSFIFFNQLMLFFSPCDACLVNMSAM